jgi:hypothetical protein
LDVLKHKNWIQYPDDVPILVAAGQTQVDFFATFNSKHFIDDPKVALRSGLLIGTPGDALAWVRRQFSRLNE